MQHLTPELCPVMSLNWQHALGGSTLCQVGPFQHQGIVLVGTLNEMVQLITQPRLDGESNHLKHHSWDFSWPGSGAVCCSTSQCACMNPPLQHIHTRLSLGDFWAKVVLPAYSLGYHSTAHDKFLINCFIYKTADLAWRALQPLRNSHNY